MVDHVGEQFGDYRLIQHLGEGAFGTVYLGERLHIKPGTLTAVKVLKAPSTEDLEIYRSFITNFIQEANAYHRLQHPNIIKLFEFGTRSSDHIPYLVMEYAPHGTLRKRHRRGEQVSLDTIVTYIQQVAAALECAHNQRLIHRDVKPENMLLDQSDRVLLSDFGIAVVAHDPSSFSPVEGIGTAAYKAPEQILRNPKPASDQYALGVVVYEWLSGRLPFNGDSHEIIQQHLHTSPPPLSSYIPMLSPLIEQVVMKALEKKPQDRYESVQEFAAELAKAYEQSQHQIKFATVEEDFVETRISDEDLHFDEDLQFDEDLHFDDNGRFLIDEIFDDELVDIDEQFDEGKLPPLPPRRANRGSPRPFFHVDDWAHLDQVFDDDEDNLNQRGQFLEPPMPRQRVQRGFAPPPQGRRPIRPVEEDIWYEEGWQASLKNFIARTFKGVYWLSIVAIPLILLIWQIPWWLFGVSFLGMLLVVLLDMRYSELDNEDISDLLGFVLGLPWFIFGWLVGSWIGLLFHTGTAFDTIFPLFIGFLSSLLGITIYMNDD
jgi:serine/threonine protein kinase